MNNNKQIGIVICNYNKSSYVVNCIQSVLESDTMDFDIYVVDNASTDDSVEQIRSCFGDKVTLLVNEANLGGSGGFNTGIRKALEGGYPYIMCLDNDVLVDEAAVSSLLSFMQAHSDIGMLGSRVYHMEEPDYVQQFGLNIDFDNYIVDTLYANVLEDGTIPEVVYCDTVATCSVLVRTEAIEKAGIMPEDNFIYWDDMEWGWRIRQAGYQVAAYGASKVLHTKGAANRNNAVFTNYYNMRNRIHFFLKYLREDQLEDFSYKMLDSVFDAMYECMYRDEHCSARALRFALDDAMHGVRGKAAAYKLENNDNIYNRLEQILQGKKTYSMEVNSCDWLAENIREYVTNHFPQMLEVQPQGELQETASVQAVEPGKCGINADTLRLVLCPYIMNVKDFSLDKVYIDEYYNIFSEISEIAIIRNYGYSKALFIYQNQQLFIENVKKIREGYK